jgi:hypothetical protein
MISTARGTANGRSIDCLLLLVARPGALLRSDAADSHRALIAGFEVGGLRPWTTAP